MRAPVRANSLALPLSAVLVVSVLVGGWIIHRERACDRMSNAIVGDVQVRRGPGGQCYVCRDEGPLYDIAYRHCVASDQPYMAS